MFISPVIGDLLFDGYEFSSDCNEMFFHILIKMKKRRIPCNKGFDAWVGTPGAIRTRDLPLRRRMLYPAELRAHIIAALRSLTHISFRVKGKPLFYTRHSLARRR